MYLKMIIFIKKGVPKSIEPVGRANSRLYKEELAKLINENINIDPAQPARILKVLVFRRMRKAKLMKILI